MKTFETEKNNIPEGATHYQEPDAQHVFAWFKLDGNKLSIKVPVRGEDSDWDDCKFEYYKGKIKIIPKPETTEQIIKWKNGDECIFSGDSYTFGCINPICDQGSVVIFDETGEYFGCFIGDLSKPESPEEKEQRERLEAAYDLYLSFKESAGCDPISFAKWSATQPTDSWLAIVDKTNYRKGE